jgi:hypothetical protein
MTAWRARLDRIRGWNKTCQDDSWLQYLVVIAHFILETGLTAETIESHVNQEIADFERRVSDEMKHLRSTPTDNRPTAVRPGHQPKVKRVLDRATTKA